ncbi:MAG: type II secretion system GspH family protein [Gammaproteobacteria bacterium]|nr:type II secretion system GspH family protein [Gammaproteobacteria bacterium]MBU1645895.1 type II secretion system GspH family protein [Gammaproteobacteria bacterium]MBU1971957.1 type II secretion system GspH family protein [Gammaproteobacteria bacterium]
MKTKQHGFTLIELIVVIVILGILGATALPRFANMTTQADKAAVAGVAGAFGSAVQLVRAQYLVTADTDGDDIVGFGDGTVDVCPQTTAACANSPGYPTDTGGNNGAPNNARCLAIWNGIMQNPPRALGQGTTVSTVGVDWNATGAAGVCTYSYRRGIADTGASTRFFTYTYTNGSIVLTNP